MTDAMSILRTSKHVLVVDWPTEDVPNSLARAGFVTTVHGGPKPDDYYSYELRGDEVVKDKTGRAPDTVDLVYTHRPVDELADIVAFARARGARAAWLQSGLDSSGAKDVSGCWMPDEESQRARDIVETAGMTYVEAPFIADVARSL
jgi:predicted CoA-binding protein